MKRIVRLAALVALIATAISAGPTGKPALAADPGTVASPIVLTGTYNPGLDQGASSRSVTLSGYIPGPIGSTARPEFVHPGPFQVTGGGTENGDLVSGSGSATVTILPVTPIPGYSFSASCSLSWTRVGLWTIWTLRCAGTIVTPYGTVSFDICIMWATMLEGGFSIPGGVWAAVGVAGPWPCS